MKREESFLNQLFRSYLSPYSFPARFLSIGHGKKSIPPLSTSGTKKSASCAPRRPSAYLSLAFLALAISAFLSLRGESGNLDSQSPRLLAKGWAQTDPPACENLKEGYFELESENSTVELYHSPSGQILSSRPTPWPEPPYHCRPIAKPSFIQEIL